MQVRPKFDLAQYPVSDSALQQMPRQECKNEETTKLLQNCYFPNILCYILGTIIYLFYTYGKLCTTRFQFNSITEACLHQKSQISFGPDCLKLLLTLEKFVQIYCLLFSLILLRAQPKQLNFVLYSEGYHSVCKARVSSSKLGDSFGTHLCSLMQQAHEFAVWLQDLEKSLVACPKLFPNIAMQ